MTEFTDGTAKGKTLSLQGIYKNVDGINSKIKMIENSISNLQSGKSGALTVKIFSATATNAAPCAILTATAQSGYQFLCWVMVWTEGAVVPVLTNHPENSKAQIWPTNIEAVAGKTIRGMALYVKED